MNNNQENRPLGGVVIRRVLLRRDVNDKDNDDNDKDDDGMMI